MLDYSLNKNEWKPPKLSQRIIREKFDAVRNGSYREYLLFITEEPYIDAVYVRTDEDDEACGLYENIRFVFREGYVWSRRTEGLFINKCLNNSDCYFDRSAMERFFRIYSEAHPEWNLKRYLTKRMRMLDHIYACLKKNTVREMLYKAGLDELAAASDSIDEYDLLSTRPSEIYEGVSMKALRALNCPEGAKLLSISNNRRFVKELQKLYPDIFINKMNDSQCRYLSRLITGDLTPGETGRLYLARRANLAKAWTYAQYDMLIAAERGRMSYEETKKEFADLDSLYIKCLMPNMNEYTRNKKMIGMVKYYLLVAREEFDRKIRVSNRKREYDWQERDRGYVVRYPQTINDFCREAVYQSNCLLTYTEALINNDTTILFMRQEHDFNKPFITIEIFRNRLAQAYHRFNEDCTPEEAAWIRDYCERHGIDTGTFEFDNMVDDLM